MTSEVTFVGGETAMADMRLWAEQVAPAVNKAADPLARRVADLVASRVPHLTGQLAGSVDTTSDDEGVGVSLGDGVEYAGWIEFGGTRGRPYVPEGRYLFPSALDAQDEYEQIASDAAGDSAGRFHWTRPAL